MLLKVSEVPEAPPADYNGEWIEVELHCHTYHSADSLMEPEELLRICQEKGLDRIAITDHNTITGAVEAARVDPQRVIIGEEIMTTGGELLGYFLKEGVPAGLDPQEAIRRLREQGAFISVAHPFDPFRRGAWDPLQLQPLVDRLDAVEVFNARALNRTPNREAHAFAMRHDLLFTAGSDAHAPSEVGRTRILLPAFRGPDGFRQALSQGKVLDRLSPPWVHMFSRYAVWRKRRGWQPKG